LTQQQQQQQQQLTDDELEAAETSKVDLANSLRVHGSALDMYFFCVERCYAEGYGWGRMAGTTSSASGPPDDISVPAAKAQCKAALEESVRLLSELRHPMLGVSQQELGMMYYYLGQPHVGTSLSHLHTALKSVERDLGPVHLETARVLFNIGLVSASASAAADDAAAAADDDAGGEMNGASGREALARCLKIRVELLGHDHASTKRTRRLLLRGA
jgi:hypothetical protein